MANKVSIFITNTEGHHFELTNSKMAIMMAGDCDTNWDTIFTESISPYDIIISDFQNNKAPAFGLGYSLVQHCNNKEQAQKIIKECREKLHEQYDRMMMIRVGKKYHLNPYTICNIELEYHNPENYQVIITKENL